MEKTVKALKKAGIRVSLFLEPSIEAMQASRTSWDLIDFQKRNEGQEYSLYFVFRKVGSGQHTSWKDYQKPPKTCGVVRYGAHVAAGAVVTQGIF